MKSKHRHLLHDMNLRRWYDNISKGSKILADVNLRRLGLFCERTGITHNELIHMERRKIEDLLQDHLSSLESKNYAPQYIAGVFKAVKSWLEWNEINLQRKIKIRHRGYTPTLKDEKVPEKQELAAVLYGDKTPIRTRCMIALVAFSGCRLEVLGNYDSTDGLVLGDLPELVIKDGKPYFKIVPCQIQVRQSLSKGGHQYITFLNEEGCNLLQEYLNRRSNSGEVLKEDTPLIAVSPSYDRRGRPREKSGSFFMSTQHISDYIRMAIRSAGYSWRPYIFRSYFDTALMIAESRGKISHAYRQFFMGHKGDIEAVYTTNKGRLPKDVIEDMRSAYQRCDEYLSTTPIVREEDPELTTLRTMVESGVLDLSKPNVRNYLIQKLGIKDMEVKVAKMKESGFNEDVAFTMIICEKLGIEPMKIEAFKPKENNDPKKIISENELERYLSEGWDVQTILPSGKILIRKIM